MARLVAMGAALARGGAVTTLGHPSRGLRVLFVHQAADLYGSDRIVLEAATALQQGGGQPIVVLAAQGPLLAALAERGIEAHVCPPVALLKLTRKTLSPLGMLRMLAALPSTARRLDACVGPRAVDLVYTNTLAVLGGAWWAWRRRVPHLWHVHEILEHPSWVAAGLTALLQAMPGRVVCNSHATLAWLLAWRPALRARSSVVINGVALPTVRVPDEALAQQAQAFRPAGAQLAIGLIGRINRMKGHHTLLDAALLLQARGVTGFSLVFVGDAPPGQAHFEQTLRQRVQASPLQPRVHFAGFMPDTTAAYACLDIVCVPSTEAESFGLVAIEAMAARKPVVAAQVGALPEVLQHGRAGLLHEAGDAQALADALERLIRDATLRSHLAACGHAHYLERYTLAAMCQALRAQMVLAQRHGRSASTPVSSAA